MEYGRNLPESWVESMTERLLSRGIGVPVSLAQDADLAAVGEAYFGAGASFEDVVYITISTGMGAGVLLGRRLVHGRRSGIEIGLTWTGPAAGDSGLGLPLEDYTSGRAVARSAAEGGLPADPVALVDLVRAGDPLATGFWERFAAVGALAAVNLAHIFSPQVIVVGGGISRTGDLLLDPIRRAVAAHGPQGFPGTIEVRPSALGDDSGLAGAAAWATAF
jgi:glucokinase